MNALSKRGVRVFVLVVSLALGLCAAGCTSTASNSGAAAKRADPPSQGFRAAAFKSTDSAAPPATSEAKQAPVPRVQECGVIAISSPSKYVCNGKVYTAVQLAKLRADEAKKYQSGH